VKEAWKAFDHLLGFMKTQAAERREELGGQTGASRRTDAFTMLVKANEDESAKYRLGDDELVCPFVVLLFPPSHVLIDWQHFCDAFRGTW
jgi:hypothetical protein